MKLNEIKEALEAKKEAERKATVAVAPIECDGVKAENPLDDLELADLNGINDDVLFAIADIAYRVAGIRTSRLVQSDPQKEIGGMIAYLLDGGKNPEQRKQWLLPYVECVNRLVRFERQEQDISCVLAGVSDLRKEKPEERAYRLLKQAKGNVAHAIELSKRDGGELPKWVFNKALERLTAEIFAKMAG